MTTKKSAMKKMTILLLTVFAFSSCDINDQKVELNKSVKEFIEERYEGATILKAETESPGSIEVEFIHEGRKKEAYFNKRTDEWIYTIWDVTIGEVPEVVNETVRNNYPGYAIDDINYVERKNLEYFEFEFEKGIIEITRHITPDGELL